ncbi:MAG TPA: ATP-binding cassette domain-containing protein [Nitrosopumilaceae archaeon]|nr:ATP-binding cassette domain-containing protein [Nitrosopumilaceae archaeon]
MKFSIETIDLTKVFTVRKDDSGSFVRRFRRGGTESIVAVDNVNLKIREGEIFGLLGPNGSGKTSITRMLCTVLTPTSGTALVNGFDVREDDLEVRKQIGVMISSGRKGLSQRLSAWNNLEFYGALYGLPRDKRVERIKFLLDFFRIKERAHDQVQRFSTGMQRRLSLCKVLLPDSPILLLDEPTLGLDVETTWKIGELLKKINKEQKKTILLTTHHLSEAEKLCDRVAIINKGKVLTCASPQILKDKTSEQSLENAYMSIVKSG